jgi:hypothetical protein
MLDMYQVVSVGGWGDKDGRKEYVESMKKRAGYEDERKQVYLPTQKELRAKMDKVYAVMNIPTVESAIKKRNSA